MTRVWCCALRVLVELASIALTSRPMNRTYVSLQRHEKQTPTLFLPTGRVWELDDTVVPCFWSKDKTQYACVLPPLHSPTSSPPPHIGTCVHLNHALSVSRYERDPYLASGPPHIIYTRRMHCFPNGIALAFASHCLFIAGRVDRWCCLVGSVGENCPD